MKSLIFLAITAIFTNSAQALFQGSIEMGPAAKSKAGYSLEYKSNTVKKGFINARDLVFSYGREGADFSLTLRGQLLLPGGDIRVPKMKIGLKSVNFNEKLSQSIYDVLSIDYTAKRIKEGVALDSVVVRCTSPESCSISDDRGYFDLFRGQPAFFGSPANEFYADLNHGRNKYKNVSFKGAYTNKTGELNKAFISNLEEMAFNLAPTSFEFQKSVRSRPDRRHSIEKHRQLAHEKLDAEISSSELEKEIIFSMIMNENITEKEGFQKSGGNCTYFCSPSGPFVRLFMTAETNF